MTDTDRPTLEDSSVESEAIQRNLTVEEVAEEVGVAEDSPTRLKEGAPDLLPTEQEVMGVS